MKTLKTLPLAIALAAISSLCFAQSQESTKEKPTLTFAEQMPEFPGGQNALMKFISENINYPDSARENMIEGKVVLQFVVNEDGSISDIKPVKSLSGGCLNESIRVLKLMPNWKPGKQNGTDVKVQFVLPITFKLTGNVAGKNDKTVIESNKENTATEQHPEYPGGEKAMGQFLMNNLHYPPDAREAGIQGKVILKVTIAADGSMSDIKVVQDIGGGCAEEAIRVFKLMPKWVPVKQDGQGVAGELTVPVTFKLN